LHRPKAMPRPVGIIARVRPFLSHEEEKGVVSVSATGRVIVHDVRHRGCDKEYDVDQVYSSTSSTRELYSDQIAEYIPSVLEGSPVTVFMHGASGSGKTHTMQGTQAELGLIPMAVRDLMARQEEGGAFKVSVSFYEILNDKVRDLFVAPKRTPQGGLDIKWLPMRDNAAGEVVIAGLQDMEVTSAAQILELWRGALKHRSVGKTALNEESSRSHCCLQISLDPIQEQAPKAKTRQAMSFQTKAVQSRAGRLYLVDLAGCEDNRKTENKGERMTESRAINSSHLSLGKVLLALRKGEKHVPYRESKLTRLLKRALDGKNRALMILTLSPSEEKFQATHNTFLSIQLAGRPVAAGSAMVATPAATATAQQVPSLPPAPTRIARPSSPPPGRRMSVSHRTGIPANRPRRQTITSADVDAALEAPPPAPRAPQDLRAGRPTLGPGDMSPGSARRTMSSDGARPASDLLLALGRRADVENCSEGKLSLCSDQPRHQAQPSLQRQCTTPRVRSPLAALEPIDSVVQRDLPFAGMDVSQLMAGPSPGSSGDGRGVDRAPSPRSSAGFEPPEGMAEWVRSVVAEEVRRQVADLVPMIDKRIGGQMAGGADSPLVPHREEPALKRPRYAA